MRPHRRWIKLLSPKNDSISPESIPVVKLSPFSCDGFFSKSNFLFRTGSQPSPGQIPIHRLKSPLVRSGVTTMTPYHGVQTSIFLSDFRLNAELRDYEHDQHNNPIYTRY